MTGIAPYIYGPHGILDKRTTINEESSVFYYHSGHSGSRRLSWTIRSLNQYNAAMDFRKGDGKKIQSIKDSVTITYIHSYIHYLYRKTLQVQHPLVSP